MNPRPVGRSERTSMLGCVLALGGCVWGGVGAGVGRGPSPGSVGLPAWTRLNGTALRRSGPQSIEILVDEPAKQSSRRATARARPAVSFSGPAKIPVTGPTSLGSRPG